MSRYLFPPFAARLMIAYAPVSKPTLTKRDLDVKTYHHVHKRKVLTLLGFTRRERWGLQADDKVRARHATPQEVEIGRIALVRSSYGCAVGRRLWKLDEKPDVGGTLHVFSPTTDGEFWVSVGSIRLKVGEDLQETRERVRTFLKAVPPIPRDV